MSLSNHTLYGSDIYAKEEAERLYNPKMVDNSKKFVFHTQQNGYTNELRDSNNMHRTYTDSSLIRSQNCKAKVNMGSHT